MEQTQLASSLPRLWSGIIKRRFALSKRSTMPPPRSLNRPRAGNAAATFHRITWPFEILVVGGEDPLR